MNTSKSIVCLIATVCLALGSGCSIHRIPGNYIRTASECPDRFVAGGAAAALRTDAALNPMVDPRDGTQIRLVRSDIGWGDYQVPSGRYGIEKGELLRLETKTGRVLGIVPK
jgi:hypothetical protein